MKTFNESMLTGYGNRESEWELLRQHYNNYQNNNSKEVKTSIPNTIHQIWLGSTLPEAYLKFSRSWTEKHPAWDYHLWTDEDVEKYQFKTKTAYNQANNPGAKSDILRYAILEEYGGLYIDTDFVCLKPFDTLNQQSTFYTGIHDYFHFMIPNGLIGVIPGHPIIKKINMVIEKTQIDNSEMENCDSLMDITGPGLFTRCVMDYLREEKPEKSDCVVFPASYFYPAPASIRSKGVDYMNGFIKEETMAIHYWEVSWVKKEKLVDRIIKKIKTGLKSFV